jgi:hypothetical protein
MNISFLAAGRLLARATSSVMLVPAERVAV